MMSRKPNAPVLTERTTSRAVATAGRQLVDGRPGQDSVRLAAVIHLDMAGYSRLTGLDERGTVTRLRDSFESVLRPLVAHNEGRIANTAGDSALLLFPGAGAAIRFAVDFQATMATREAGVAADRAMRFRLGVTVADVLETTGTDVHGDGVNVAARLQTACPPGAICVSRSVRDQVQGKLDATFEPMGTLQLKNIARPVEAYLVRARSKDTAGWRWTRWASRRGWGVRARWLAVLAALTLFGGSLGMRTREHGAEDLVGTSAAAMLPDLSVKHAPRLSLAVLPFANTSGDPSQDYLADAVTDDLTTDLSRLSGALVIGRRSAEVYRGQHLPATQIGGELGVRYLVQGSVRRIGDATVRVNGELVSTETGEVSWAERFDQDMRDLGQGQGDIVRRLAYVLETRLVASEAARSLRERPDDPDAFDLVLRARSLSGRYGDRQHAAEAQALYERALQLDPRSLPAMVGLANRLLSNIVLLKEGRPNDLPRAEQLLAAAEAERPDSLGVVQLRAFVRRVQGRCDEAIAAYQQVIDSDPNAATAYGQIAICKMRQGLPAEAVPLLRENIRRSPAGPEIWTRYALMGEALLRLRQPADAIPWLQRALDTNPARDERSSVSSRVHIVSALAHAGHATEARQQLAEATRLGLIPFLTVRSYEARAGQDQPNVAQRLYIADGLRRAGLRDHVEEDADAGVPDTAELHADAFGSTPLSAPGATTIRTDRLQHLLEDGHPVVLALNATGRSLPGAVVLRDTFLAGSLDDDKQRRLQRKMHELTGNDPARPIVVLGWNAERWGPRNLALRLVALGYSQVFWYRGGKEVWEAAGLPETDAAPTEW